MAMIENGRMSRDVLPPINQLDFERSRHEKREPSRFPMMPGLSISTAPLTSPNTIYSGPPPPYSCGPSTTESAHGLSGYFSPPQPSSRRLTWDEKNSTSAKTLPSLPSLHEALGGDKPMSFPGPPSASQTHPPGPTPTTTFPDVPRGPSNPFTQSVPPPPIPTGHAHNEAFLPKTVGTRTSSLVSEAPLSASQPYSSSPQVNSGSHRPSAASISSTTRPFESHHRNLSFLPEADMPNPPPLREYPPQSPATQSHPSGSFHFEPTHKFDDSRNPFVRNHAVQSYGDTVKRHLDGFDAEMALNEIAETSNRTLDFSRSWVQRHHQSNRTTCLAETAPSMQEIDEMIRQQSHVLQNLERIRQTVIAQQNQMSEQRARAARGHMEDEYHQMHDEYKNGGFAGGDAKKRRGKAAPPGRCHSCNRAETPEWRRGPDGARTLCNACGLHYAKLTRKLGANKAGALTGSNLRPKGLDTRPGHV